MTVVVRTDTGWYGRFARAKLVIRGEVLLVTQLGRVVLRVPRAQVVFFSTEESRTARSPLRVPGNRRRRRARPANVHCPRCGAGVRPDPARPRWQCADDECAHRFEAEGVPAPMCGTKMI